MQPQSPDKQFDFMLKNDQPAKSGIGLKLPKPFLIAIAVILLIVIIIAASTLLSGRKSGATQPIVDSVARGQEVIRVTAIVQKLGLHDQNINAVSSTVLAVLLSDQKQMVQYLAVNKVKVSPAQISADTDRSVDNQMESALQSNGLDQAYVTYLQQYLPKYQNDLQIALNTAPGPAGKQILKTAISSEAALLTTPPLKP